MLTLKGDPMNYVYLMHGYCVISLSLSLSFFGVEATLFPFELEMLQIYFFLGRADHFLPYQLQVKQGNNIYLNILHSSITV